MFKAEEKLFLCVLILLIPLTNLLAQKNNEATELSVASSYVISKKDSLLIRKYQNLNFRYLKGEDSKLILKEVLFLNSEAELANDYKILALNNYLIGQIFSSVDDFDKARIFYLNSLLYFNKESNSSNLDSNFKSKNSIFENKIFLKLASNYQRREEIDSSLYYYNKIINSPFINKENLTIKAKSYANASDIYYNLKDFEKAEEFAIESISIHKGLNNKIAISSSMNNLANIYLRQELFEKARDKYEEAINLIKFDESSLAIKRKEDLYFNYAYALYNLKDYKAYEYLEDSYEIKDSIRELGIKKAFEEIYAINNVEKVKKEEALKRAEANKKMWLIILSSAILIIALAFIAGFYRLRQKNLRLKLSQSELLQEKKIEKLKSISQKRILNATLDGKETERKEIAETLHDSVSALLSSANMHLQASRNQFNGSTPIEIEKSQKIITEASQKIRNLSHNLVSSVLLKFGIEYAIKDLISKYSNSQINFEAHTDGISRFNQNFEIKIHNIIQELVNNILKHSEASQASISIDEFDDKLFILISDNGKGFSTKDIQVKDGLGLNQIEARIQMMDGTFAINSEPKKGTDIEIEIPISKEKITSHV